MALELEIAVPGHVVNYFCYILVVARTVGIDA